MFAIDDKVKVIWEGTRFDGMEGSVVSIHLNCDPDEVVYMLRYNNGNGGMFKESQMQKLNLEVI